MILGPLRNRYWRQYYLHIATDKYRYATTGKEKTNFFVPILKINRYILKNQETCSIGNSTLTFPKIFRYFWKFFLIFLGEFPTTEALNL